MYTHSLLNNIFKIHTRDLPRHPLDEGFRLSLGIKLICGKYKINFILQSSWTSSPKMASKKFTWVDFGFVIQKLIHISCDKIQPRLCFSTPKIYLYVLYVTKKVYYPFNHISFLQVNFKLIFDKCEKNILGFEHKPIGSPRLKKIYFNQVNRVSWCCCSMTTK